LKLPYSLEIERTFLATLVKNPEIVPEYLEHLSDDLFFNDVHKIIAGSIRAQFPIKKTIDPVIIADYIKNIGLSRKDDLDVPDYIWTITSQNAVHKEKAEVYFEDCYKYKIARAVINQCMYAASEINKRINRPISEIVSIAEKALSKAVTSAIQDEYKPVDIYKDMLPFLESLATSQTSGGIKTPFPTWNRWWGNLTRGDLTVIASPPKTGKSTILSYIADVPFCRFNKGKNVKVLVLDTELESERVKSRKAAALTEVGWSFIQDGRWLKNEEYTGAVLDKKDLFEKRANGAFKHLYVPGVPMEKIKSIIRRWRATETEPDDECLIIYDYLKITGEKVDDSNKEWQVMGEKCNALKEIVSEVRATGLACIQTNEVGGVAMSARIKWFASNILMFRRKTPEEISEHGEEYGTHILQPVELRNLGDDWVNEQWVKEVKDKGTVYLPNWLNLEVSNFNIFERGTRRDISEHGNKQIDIDPPKKKLITVEDDLI